MGLEDSTPCFLELVFDSHLLHVGHIDRQTELGL